MKVHYREFCEVVSKNTEKDCIEVPEDWILEQTKMAKATIIQRILNGEITNDNWTLIRHYDSLLTEITGEKITTELTITSIQG